MKLEIVKIMKLQNDVEKKMPNLAVIKRKLLIVKADQRKYKFFEKSLSDK